VKKIARTVPVRGVQLADFDHHARFQFQHLRPNDGQLPDEIIHLS